MAKNSKQWIRNNLGKMIDGREKMLNGPYRSSMGRNEEPDTEALNYAGDPVWSERLNQWVDPEMIELDRLISLGWGDVPQPKIKAIVKKLGYMPSKPPRELQEQPEAIEWSKAQLIEVDGVVRTLREWSEVSGLHVNCIFGRIYRGWDPKAAIETPRRKSGRKRKVKSKKPQKRVAA